MLEMIIKQFCSCYDNNVALLMNSDNDGVSGLVDALDLVELKYHKIENSNFLVLAQN